MVETAEGATVNSFGTATGLMLNRTH